MCDERQDEPKDRPLDRIERWGPTRWLQIALACKGAVERVLDFLGSFG